MTCINQDIIFYHVVNIIYFDTSFVLNTINYCDINICNG